MDYDQVLRTDGAKEFRQPKGVTEDNWKSRMSFCANLTDAINSFGHDQLPKDFTVQIEPLFNNILECAVSERTQLSNSACRLLEKLPEVLEREMHPHLDRVLPVLLKLCANTKQVTVKVAAAAVVGVIRFSTYSPRLLWHICQVFEEKPAGPKIHATTWLQTILKDYHRQVDLHKDGRMLSRAISLALEDADAQVRTKSRATYWTYSRFDPEGAQEIMEKLNNHARTALQNDPSNPNKKTAAAQKEPPRPRSALADVRKEQARKKRAEEEAQKQKKTFNTSTTSHDAIEIHEPRKDRPQKADKPDVAKATAIDKTNEVWQPAPKPSVNPTAHKKVLSQDNEVVAKPSASSRLLSAPVRRPRINVTPMNAPQTSRPSSRTGHSVQPREKEPQKDSRPTSSSSWKSASIGATAVTSPKLKATTVTVPKSKSIPSPTMKAPFIPDGKENAPAQPLKTKRTPVQVPGTPKSFLTTANVSEDTKTRQMDANNAVENHRAQKANFEAEVLPKGQISHDTSTVEYSTSAYEPHVVERHVGYENLASLDTYPDIPRESKSKIPSSNTRTRRDDARRYLKTTLEEGRFARNKLDALELRKLKHIFECYPEDLVQDEETYNRLFETLCYALGSIEDINQESPHSKTLYCRGLILQMSTPLLNNYPAWSWKYWPLWIECMIYYRCTLTTEASDRQVRYLRQSVLEVINHHREPLGLIDSVTTAIHTAEPILLRVVDKSEAAFYKQRKVRQAASSNMDGRDEQAEAEPSPIEENSFATHTSWNPYPGRGYRQAVGETARHMKSGDIDIQHVKDYMKKALNEYNILTIDHDRPYPKTLPLLWDFSLEVYTFILSRAIELGDSLQPIQESELCTIASHCLSSYDYVVKKAVVLFVKVLFTIINNEDKFFDYFQDENQQNLLEYYVFDSRR